jgi:glc operon protein GlcG
MDTFEKRSIGIEAAQRVIDAAFREADGIGIKVTVAVVDESGVLKAFGRQDGSALINTQSSQNKANTAVSLGLATRAWYPMIKDDPALLHGVVGALDVVIFGGGVPLKVDGHLVGAVGVGGGSADQDHQVAEAATRALEGAPA